MKKMSKNIYEEALEMIERNTFPLPVGFAVLINKTKIEQTLKQAQKQEKVLELYRELMTIKDELISIAWFDSRRVELEEEEATLEKIIKELEYEKK